jgi:hypothetical protein
MNPTPKDVRIDPLLTKISLGYKNQDIDFIAEKLFPIIPVKKDAAQIATYRRDNMRITKTLRAPGVPANKVDHRVSIGDHYSLEEHALSEDVADELKENADIPIRPEMDAAENITEKLWLTKEKAVADVVRDTGIMTQNTTLSGTDQWSDYANSDPFDDVKTAITTIRSGSGKIANTMVIGFDVYQTLLQHPAVQEKIKFVMVTSPDQIKVRLAELFGIKTLLVGQAQYEAGNEGQADSATLTDIWVEDCIICYVDSNPGLKSRSLGMTYQKTGKKRSIDKWYEIANKATTIRCTDKYDQKLIDAKCGYLINDAI